MIIFYLIFIKLEKNIDKQSKNIYIVSILFAIVILLWCAGISLLDQQKSGQFIVYAVATICVAVTPYYKPLTLLFVYLIVHIPFLILMPYFQSSPMILYDNYINSTTFIIISWAISYMRYKRVVQELNNRKIIENQRYELIKANKKLEELTRLDYLTGINNRYVFDEVIKLEWDRCKRHFTQLSLIMLDIDYFKAFNDNYGHQVGDECLKLIAQVLMSSATRSSDTVSRYGGEEFSIILPYLNKEDAQKVAEKIKEKVEQLDIPHMYSSISNHVTISIGVNSVVPSNEITEKDFIRIADDALYKAKEDRNKVVVA